MADPVPTQDDLRDNAAFEALMWAMARPGSLHDLPGGIADLVLALVDRECRVLVDDPSLAQVVAATGAALVAAEGADHAFLTRAEGALAVLAALPAGSPLYPDQGATLVLPATLGQGQRLRLTGPGIEGATEVHISGLPDGFIDLRAARCRYPEGVDMVFVDVSRIMALPRSTTVEGI